VLERMFRLLLLFSALVPTIAHAAIGDRYGFSSENAALAGATAGVGEMSSASVFDNPAQMSLLPDGKTSGVRFHWSTLYSEPKFSDVTGVVIENPVNSDLNSGDRIGNVNTEYPATFGQSIGFSIRSKKSERHWSLGAVAYLPLDHIALLDSGESFLPEYTLHRGRTQKPEFQFALAGLVTNRLSFGLGIYLGARLTANTTLFLNQGNGTASTMRLAASLKTQATPYFGLTYLASDSLSLGLVARLATRSPESINVQANARAVGTVNAPDFSFPALATMYYDPLTLTLGSEWKYSDTRTLYLQLDYQAWSNFESPAIVILNQQCDPNCGVDFADGRNLGRPTHDILIPRVGHTWRFNSNLLRVGYLYRSGIYRELPTGTGNAIDPDEHRLTAGYAWGFDAIPFFDAPGRLSLHGAFSLFPKKTVVKTSGDENANLANRKIGAPGFDTGGYEWGTGATLEFFL
jgi:hypothetical protein